MLLATLIVLLLVAALVFAPMGLTAIKARANRRNLPGEFPRERRPPHRPADIGR